MKKLLALYFILNCCVGSKAQDAAFYQKFFPDPNYPMPVPVIRGDKSFDYYTKYSQVVQFIKDQAERHPTLIKIGSIGKTQQGRDQVSVLLTNQKIDNKEKLRVTLIGCIHGNEPISTEGMLFLIYRLTQETQYAGLLDHMQIQVLPDVNADGRESDKRATSNGIDLNRDLTTLDAPESRNIKIAINQFDPQVVLDFHEFNPHRSDFKELSDCYSIGYDAMFLYTGNLNVDPAIRRMIAEDFVAPTKTYLTQNKREVSDYATSRRDGKEILLNMGGTASRSSATNYALQNRISLLMEIRGVTEGNKAVKRRIETSFLLSTSYLKIADNLRNQIRATIDSANKRSIDGSRKIIVTSKPTMREMPYLFVDECTNKHKTIEFRTYYNGVQVPVITRTRPGGYLIFPCSKKVKSILTISGVTLSEVANQQEMSVQVYKKNNKGSFTLETEKIEIPKGALIVDALQPMGNSLSDLIEPEGSNSIYTSGEIKISSKTETLPIYRISHEQLSKL
jgi:hypothetical protein